MTLRTTLTAAALICMSATPSFGQATDTRVKDQDLRENDWTQGKGPMRKSMGLRKKRNLENLFDNINGTIRNKGEWDGTYQSTIRQTPLLNFFKNKPYEKENTWPRVAITVLEWETGFTYDRATEDNFKSYYSKDSIERLRSTDYSTAFAADGCWMYSAVIWRDENTRQDVEPFSVCNAELFQFEGASVVDIGLWGGFPHTTWENTGGRRTVGPLPPKRAIEDSPSSPQIGGAFGGGINRETVGIANLLLHLGFNWKEAVDGRLWLVGWGPDSPKNESAKPKPDPFAMLPNGMPANMPAMPSVPNPAFAKGNATGQMPGTMDMAALQKQAEQMGLGQAVAAPHMQALGLNQSEASDSFIDLVMDGPSLIGQTVTVKADAYCVQNYCTMEGGGQFMSFDASKLPRADKKVAMFKCTITSKCKNATITGVVKADDHDGGTVLQATSFAR
ncbi:MAG: hypothetical protein AAF862_06110 [Pseudomonadota bacterium]